MASKKSQSVMTLAVLALLLGLVIASPLYDSQSGGNSNVSGDDESNSGNSGATQSGGSSDANSGQNSDQNGGSVISASGSSIKVLNKIESAVLLNMGGVQGGNGGNNGNNSGNNGTRPDNNQNGNNNGNSDNNNGNNNGPSSSFGPSDVSTPPPTGPAGSSAIPASSQP